MGLVEHTAPAGRRTFVRHLLTLASLWGLAFSRRATAAQAIPAGPPRVDDVRRASDGWFEALRQTDVATIDRTETDDFMTIQEAPTGVAVIEKATQLASLKTAKTPARLQRSLTNVKIRHYGDTAILTAIAAFSREGAAATSANRAVITEVWVRQDQRWRIAHFGTHPVHPRVRG